MRTVPRFHPRSFRAAPVLVGCCALLSVSLRAQVSVTGSNGANGQYTTLAAAFTAINANTHTGNIYLYISGSTTEPAGGAVLNAGTWNSLLVQPGNGVEASVSGAIANGFPLIDLNGADRVTIDGQNGGGTSLTLTNTNVNGAAGSSTVRFINDASNNVITHCTIRGGVSFFNETGTVLFHTAAPGGSGNDNNTISQCEIGPLPNATPRRAIMSHGTTSGPGQYNTGNQILQNNIFDFFYNAGSSQGVFLYQGTSTWTIYNNRFYQTAPRTMIAPGAQAAILVGHADNNGHLITANRIGYANAAGTGQYVLNGPGSPTSVTFKGIEITAHGTLTATSIRANTVAGIGMSGGLGNAFLGTFAGIAVENGLVNIGTVTGNTIGSVTSPNSIQVSSAISSQLEAYGINCDIATSVTIANNKVGGIQLTHNGPPSGGGTIMGIRVLSSSTALTAIRNNTIGLSAAPLVNTSTSIHSRTVGIYTLSGSTVVSDNTVSDLTLSAANPFLDLDASVAGIIVDNFYTAFPPWNVAHNTVCRLSNTSTAAVQVQGIVFNGPEIVPGVVERNLVHTLACGGPAGSVTGINALGGSTTCANNMVRLGITTGGTPVATGFGMSGLRHVAGDVSLYHNSVYIGGAPNGGASDTYALLSEPDTVMRTYWNNILFNACSNAGGTGKHYAVRVALTDPVLSSDRNVLRATGTGGMTGRVAAADAASLAAWQVLSGKDPQSIAADPNYLAPNTATPNLHVGVPTPVESAGAAVALINDYDNEARAALTPTDIGADAGNFNGPDVVSVAVRIFLEGPFDPSTVLMSDALRSAGLVPTSEPYTAMGYSYIGSSGGSTTPAVLAVTGNDAVEDWVIVELRSAVTPSMIVASRSALLQRDGDVVHTDGITALTFPLAPGNYYVAVRHRNHLGVMTWGALPLSSPPFTLDLRQPSVPTYGPNSGKIIGAVRALWAGDANHDGLLKYAGLSNDRDPILLSVGGSTPNNTIAGYLNVDTNLDGLVRYTGLNNDRDLILINVGNTTPNNTRAEQLP